MAQAIALGDTGLSQLAPLAEGAQCFADSPLAPVVTQTGRVLCIGLNYRQHAKECGLPLPPAPVPFCKFSNALAAHGDAVKLMPDYKEYDYEAELVVVMGRPARDVLAVTMPCFGTTKRTRSNAEILCDELQVSFKEIDIANTVHSHFADIGQDESVLDVTFENGQARVFFSSRRRHTR